MAFSSILAWSIGEGTEEGMVLRNSVLFLLSFK